MLVMLHVTTRKGKQQPIIVNLNTIRYARQVDLDGETKTVLAFIVNPPGFSGYDTGGRSVDDSRLFVDESVSEIYERANKQKGVRVPGLRGTGTYNEEESLPCQPDALRRSTKETPSSSRKPSKKASPTSQAKA